ncbi:glutathione S-transferase family protein [Algibacillus agarilyticus]|uniref:glutathione S-transferase family protein n=1 Tax=Algibacillus agarilyticus TaxID=2234133 RepID=UPI000DCF819E|nr:glutathione S-transferase family protein [Algibacillus agarilyticus]
MYTLYSIPGSCSTGIHILLNKLNISVDVVNRSDVADYAARVATNQVPALQYDNYIITEGAAIVLHLFRQHNIDTAVYGGDQEFQQWLLFNYATLHPAYSKLFTVNALLNEGPDKQAFKQALARKTADLWKILDTRLAEKTFVLGNEPSIVDYLIAIYANWGNAFDDVSIPLGNNVKRVIKHVIELPEFIQAFEREGATYALPANS